MGQDKVVFVGSGWGFLWRTFLAYLGSLLIITIPWIIVWYISWVTRNIVINPIEK